MIVMCAKCVQRRGSGGAAHAITFIEGTALCNSHALTYSSTTNSTDTTESPADSKPSPFAFGVDLISRLISDPNDFNDDDVTRISEVISDALNPTKKMKP